MRLIAVIDRIGNGGIERNVSVLASYVDLDIYGFGRTRSTKLITPNLTLRSFLMRCTDKNTVVYVQNFRFLLPLIILKIFSIKIVYHVPIALPAKFRRIYRFVFRRINLLLVSTEGQRRDPLFNGLKNIQVAPCLLDKSFVNKQPKPRKYRLEKDKLCRLLFVGRIAEQKGLDIFLDIVKTLRSRGYRIQASVYGIPGHEELYVKHMLNRMSKENIEYYGEVLVTPELFDNYDIFLFPSRYEGFGITLAEAMLSGIPLLSSDCKFGPSTISQRNKFFKCITNYSLAKSWIEFLINNEVYNDWDGSIDYSTANYHRKIINHLN